MCLVSGMSLVMVIPLIPLMVIPSFDCDSFVSQSRFDAYAVAGISMVMDMSMVAQRYQMFFFFNFCTLQIN